jgi:hypothetical protein
MDLLQPRERFAALDRMEDYDCWVQKLKSERKACLDSFPDLAEEIRSGL